VTTKTPDALKVTSKTENNVTTYNVDANTGSISVVKNDGSATFDTSSDPKYGSRLTNVSTVTDIVNNVSWKLDSAVVAGSNGKVTNDSAGPAQIKASNTVNINAGDNIEIKRNGSTIEISATG
jgi:autotransporter adhesin (fragment)